MKDLKDSAREIFLQTLKSLSVENLIKRKIEILGSELILEGRRIDLSGFKDILLVAVGKASISMAKAIEVLLEDRLRPGLLISEHKSDVKVKSEIIVGGHPTPDSQSLNAGRRLIEIIQSVNADSLIIFLISGGGSALAELPITDEITLEDIQELNRLLVTCGASIREINTVRKHLSRIKGGRLGYMAKDLSCFAIYLSDVNPGDINSIASNPLLPDSATLVEFYSVIDMYDLKSRLPRSIIRMIDENRIVDLPRKWSSPTGSMEVLLLADNNDAVEVAAKVAGEAGFQVAVDKDNQEGNYRQVAESLIGDLKRLQSKFPDKSVCIVSGGEVSCSVTGDGLGGRNQEFVLYSAARLSEQYLYSKTAVLSCGTDGIDGNSNAAGAVATDEMIHAAKKNGLDASDFIRRNDSHSFFSIIGGLIQTGPSGNNLRDLRLFLSSPD